MRRFIAGLLGLVAASVVAGTQADGRHDSKVPVLDAPLPDLWTLLDKYRGSHLAMNISALQWSKPEVTVAFSGGDDDTYRLIEETANEWTAHGSHFRFSFRNDDGSFRRWSSTDTTASADIRIAFDPVGYTSYPGTLAHYIRPGLWTVSLASLPQQVRRYNYTHDRTAWRKSYDHSAVLHEFGHVLGLAHEHFHPECQDDLRLVSDTGYERTDDASGHPIPDANHNNPGVLLYDEVVYHWTDQRYARFQEDAELYSQVIGSSKGYFSSELPFEDNDQKHIDQKSVMLYFYPPYLLRSGANSKCSNLGDGVGSTDRDRRFATSLSPTDIAFFRRFYDHPLGV